MVGREGIERAVTWVLAVTLVVALVAVAAIAVNPPETTDPYTEFYLLGPDGNASGYPTTLSPGESGDLVVGITNHEQREVTYTLRVTWNGTVTQEHTIEVADEETVEEALAITAPPDPGRYNVRFELFRGEVSGEPYRFGRLWVTVEG
jgi:uncharacterized membrane protein